MRCRAAQVLCVPGLLRSRRSKLDECEPLCDLALGDFLATVFSLLADRANPIWNRRVDILNMRRDNFKHYYRFRAVQSFVALGLQGVWGGTGYCKPTA